MEYIGTPIAFSAVILSHPFEVARVRMQFKDKSMFGDLPGTYRSLYQTEGATGFFRGLTPRMIQLTPIIGAWSAYNFVNSPYAD